jgi:hypothetical protein
VLLLALVLPPLAVYLLALGWVNRRPRPVTAAGTWDFAGVLFALSGFLLFGGPALLGSLDEQSRWYWLLGQAEPAAAAAGDGRAGLAVRLLYFAAVAGAAAFALWRGRGLTSIYNVDAHSVFPALEQALRRLGLHALRAGDAFILGQEAAPGVKAKEEGIQAAPPPAAPPTRPSAAVHVDVFPLMRHATLRWTPADAAPRREVERELALALAETAPPDADSILGAALSLVGVVFFVIALVSAGLLLVFRFFPPR